MTFRISIETDNKQSTRLRTLASGSGVPPLPLRGIPPYGQERAPHRNQGHNHQREEMNSRFLSPPLINQPGREV